MSLLRSTLLIAMIAAFALTGCGWDAFGECCAERQHTQSTHGTPPSDDPAPHDKDGCQCSCHEVVALLTPESLHATVAILIAADEVASLDEIPPDALPLGIDRPPQLA